MTSVEKKSDDLINKQLQIKIKHIMEKINGINMKNFEILKGLEIADKIKAINTTTTPDFRRKQIFPSSKSKKMLKVYNENFWNIASLKK